MTWTLVTTPTANFSGERLELSTGNMGGQNFAIPLLKDKVLYFNFTAGGTAWLITESPENFPFLQLGNKPLSVT
jgi:hypothetical protein